MGTGGRGRGSGARAIGAIGAGGSGNGAGIRAIGAGPGSGPGRRPGGGPGGGTVPRPIPGGGGGPAAAVAALAPTKPRARSRWRKVIVEAPSCSPFRGFGWRYSTRLGARWGGNQGKVVVLSCLTPRFTPGSRSRFACSSEQLKQTPISTKVHAWSHLHVSQRSANAFNTRGRFVLASTSHVVRAARCGAAAAGPVRVEELPPRFVRPLIGVRAEVIPLRLQQVRRQSTTAEAIVIRQRRRHRR
jgi:hypothetical protein